MEYLSHLAVYYQSYNYGYGYHYAPATSADTAAGLLFAVTFMLFTAFAVAVIYVISAWWLGRIFHKAGVPKWVAWVPFYNNWKLLELGNQQGFWAVLAIIPIVNIVSVVFMYIAMYHVGLKLGKDGSWVVLAILLPPVWLGILAFDKSTWHDKPAHVSA